MARTAIVNPRRRKAAKKRRRRSYGRKRNPRSTMSGDRSYNPRRRTRRRAAPKRRRNPAAPASSVYSSGGLRRRNPDFLDFDGLMNDVPACTAGVWGARWAVKMAGAFESAKGHTEAGQPATRLVPGVKHAFAIYLAAKYGSEMIGSALGAENSKKAYYAALGFGGDLFARTRLFDDSEWVQNNLYLAGVDDAQYADGEAPDYEEMNGFEADSALGEGEFMVGPDGTLYQMGDIAPDPADMPGGVGGFEATSALGFGRMGRASVDSSFGYSP